jgi:RNA polymerase sigma-70 factor, ECF subfamily
MPVKRRFAQGVTGSSENKSCHTRRAAAFINKGLAESDPDLVTLLRARDPRGFELCYARYRDAIYAFLLRLSGRRALAEDLFQETWLRLARGGAELRPDSDLRGWLFTVARNAFRSFLRKERAQATDAELGEIAGPSDAEQSLGLSEVERALLRLPLDERELLLLVAVEGFAQDELARMLGIAAPALRQRVRRARAHLAEILDFEPASAWRKRSRHG